MRFISETTVALTLQGIEKLLIERLEEGELDVAGIRAVFRGYTTQLDISPACALPQDAIATWPQPQPETLEVA